MANISHKINQIDEKVTAIYKQIEALEAEAKTFLQKSQHSKGSAKDMYKQKCLMALKKKKALQQQAKSYNSHQNMLQQGVFNIEAANAHKEMYEGLKGAVNAQKQAMKQMDIDKLDELQDQMLEMKMQSGLLNQMMARNYDMDVDQDEFQEQFMEFEKEVAIEKKGKMANIKKEEIKGQEINNFLH